MSFERKVSNRKTPIFQIIETMKWQPDGDWFLLDEHLRRLQRSAKYFDFLYQHDRILARLNELLPMLRQKNKPALVRLLLNRSGEVKLSHTPLNPLQGIKFVAISSKNTNSQDRFLFHKTTNRQFYDNALKAAIKRNLFDFIFCNEKGEITEGARSNIIIRKGHTYNTPPITCGVLPGVYRSYLFNTNKIAIAEKALHYEDLVQADEIFMCNAVRGLLKVAII